MPGDRLKVTSPAFSEGNPIPSKYTCDGENISPPIHIENIPEGARSLALIMDDPDAPAGTFVHWVCWNVDLSGVIPEGVDAGEQGMTHFHRPGYGGPCPPSGVHRYYFKVFALDKRLAIDSSATKESLLEAMQGHILASGTLMGTYARKQ